MEVTTAVWEPGQHDHTRSNDDNGEGPETTIVTGATILLIMARKNGNFPSLPVVMVVARPSPQRMPNNLNGRLV